MLKKSRFYFSVMFAALILASLLITPNAKACGEPPQTLLSLYLNSELIVLAKYENNGESRKISEDEHGYSTETARNLAILKVFKGQKELKNASFMYTEYFSHQNPPNAETSVANEETGEHAEAEYLDVSSIKVGGEYLFFLDKNDETGQYGITDYDSGVKKVGGDLEVYEKSLNELGDIVASGENQSAKLAEWLVRNIEDPNTREDGINDLANVLYSSSNQQSQQIDKKEETAAEQGDAAARENEENHTAATTTADAFAIHTAGVAKKLSPSQIARVSAVLYPMLQEAWFAESPQYVNYGISTILGEFDKTRLAIYAYNSLHSASKEDDERRLVIMDFLIMLVEDQNLSNLYYSYSELGEKIKAEREKDTPEAKKQLKILLESKKQAMSDFDKRFKFMHERNFVKVEEKEA